MCAYSVPLCPLAGLKGLYFFGEGGDKGRDVKVREWREREGRRGQEVKGRERK